MYFEAKKKYREADQVTKKRKHLDNRLIRGRISPILKKIPSTKKKLHAVLPVRGG